jgi:hypothetical protein
MTEIIMNINVFVNQAVQCNQFGNPIIFMASCKLEHETHVNCVNIMKSYPSVAL